MLNIKNQPLITDENINIAIYYSEILGILEAITSLFQKLDSIPSIVNARKDFRGIIVKIEPHQVISSILSHVARLDKLFRAASKKPNETDEAYNFRVQRSKTLKKLLLPSKKPTEIFKSSIRNAIEHLDDRIDAISKNEFRKKNKGKLICYQMTLSTKSIFESWSNVIPLKVFVMDINEYFMLNEKMEIISVNLKKLRFETKNILIQCYNSNPNPKEAKPSSGGMMVKL